MSRRLTYFSALILIIVLHSCKKDTEEGDRVPTIEFVSISESTVVSFENEVSLSLSYADNNGDIGYTDPDEPSLRVKDARLSESDWYHVPPLTPNSQELSISGTFSVQLNTLFLLGNAQQEITNFSIQLQDREGNWSNTIVTPDILIVDSL